MLTLPEGQPLKRCRHQPHQRGHPIFSMPIEYNVPALLTIRRARAINSKMVSEFWFVSLRHIIFIHKFMQWGVDFESFLFSVHPRLPHFIHVTHVVICSLVFSLLQKHIHAPAIQCRTMCTHRLDLRMLIKIAMAYDLILAVCAARMQMEVMHGA